MLVPRPISSISTRLRAVALLRILAVSVISTIKVERPESEIIRRPDAGEDAVDGADAGAVGGHEAPIWASSTMSAVWRM